MTREAERGTAAALLAAEAGQEANRMARSTQFHERIAARTAAGEARREREKADARAEAAYAIAERNANAAAAMAKTSEETAERQLRAYLTVAEAFSYGMNKQQQPTFQITIKNQGQTPAYGVQLLSRLNWTTGAPEDVVVNFTEPFSRIGTVGGGGVRVYTSASAGFAWPPGLYDAVISKQAILVYSGVIVYRDAFRKRRLTTFMAYLNIDNFVDERAVLTMVNRGNRSN